VSDQSVHPGTAKVNPKAAEAKWVPALRLQLPLTDGMRRPVSGRDAVRSQVIDVLKAQIKRRPTMK